MYLGRNGQSEACSLSQVPDGFSDCGNCSINKRTAFACPLVTPCCVSIHTIYLRAVREKESAHSRQILSRATLFPDMSLSIRLVCSQG
jgi:hypothetical protein